MKNHKINKYILQLFVSFSLFFLPNTRPPQASSQRGGSRYDLQSYLSTLRTKPSKTFSFQNYVRFRFASNVSTTTVVIHMMSIDLF